jgi:type I restriction enzyme M protein
MLTTEEHGKNNLPDVLARWGERDGKEKKRPRTAQSFCVPKDEIVGNGYDLSLNRYKEVVHEVVDHVPPGVIMQELGVLEQQIAKGMKDLEGMLGEF